MNFDIFHYDKKVQHFIIIVKLIIMNDKYGLLKVLKILRKYSESILGSQEVTYIWPIQKSQIDATNHIDLLPFRGERLTNGLLTAKYLLHKTLLARHQCWDMEYRIVIKWWHFTQLGKMTSIRLMRRFSLSY